MTTIERTASLDNKVCAYRLSLESFCLYVFTFVMLFQAPLQILLFNNVHYIIYILLTLILLIKNRFAFVLNTKVLFFFLFIGVYIFISAFFLPSVFISLIGAIDYFVAFLFPILYLAMYGDKFNIKQYSKFIIYLITIFALFGIYQRFVDPTLFGIMNRISDYYSFETLQYDNTFRIASFFNSPTAYPLAVGIAIALLFDIRKEFNTFLWLVLLVVLNVGGLASASKVFVFIEAFAIIIHIVRYFVAHKRLTFKVDTVYKVVAIGTLVVVALVVLSGRIVSMFNTILPSIRRIFLIFSDYSKFSSQEAGRIEYMKPLFESDLGLLLFGHGLGTTTYSAEHMLGDTYTWTRLTLESYGLSWWYEMGILGFLVFLYFFGIRSLLSLLNKDVFSITRTITFVCMFITPAFYNVSLMFLWFYFFYDFYRIGNKQLIHSSKQQGGCYD